VRNVSHRKKVCSFTFAKYDLEKKGHTVVKYNDINSPVCATMYREAE